MECKHCGVNLPDDAKFCLQCGTPVQPEEPEQPKRPAQPQRELDFVQPALTGGMFLGLLSSVPFISAGCCLWILMGGGIAAIMVLRQRPSGITYGDGAFAGVLSGLFGAVVGTTVQMSVHLITARFFQAQQQQIEQQMQEMFRQLGAEGPFRDWAMRVFSGEVSAVTVGFTFFANLLTYSLFAMIGGIIAIAIINRRRTTETQWHRESRK